MQYWSTSQKAQEISSCLSIGFEVHANERLVSEMDSQIPELRGEDVEGSLDDRGTVQDSCALQSEDELVLPQLVDVGTRQCMSSVSFSNQRFLTSHEPPDPSCPYVLAALHRHARV